MRQSIQQVVVNVESDEIVETVRMLPTFTPSIVKDKVNMPRGGRDSSASYAGAPVSNPGGGLKRLLCMYERGRDYHL